VAYRNGAPVRVTVRYGNGASELTADKRISVSILCDTSTELVGELRDPLGSSFGFLKIDKRMPKCEFSQTQP
jgi:hypothetical protein